MPTIDFPITRPYAGSPPHAEPLIPVKLTRIDEPGRSVHTIAIVDSGASHCVFQRPLGERLGLEMTDAHPISVKTAGGPEEMYAHRLRVELLGQIFECLVYFQEEEKLKDNLLGRQGVFDQIHLGFRQSRLEFYLRLEP